MKTRRKITPEELDVFNQQIEEPVKMENILRVKFRKGKVYEIISFMPTYTDSKGIYVKNVTDTSPRIILPKSTDS